MTIGALDPAKYNHRSLVTVKNVNRIGFWETPITSVEIGGKAIPGLENRTGILDTGTVRFFSTDTDLNLTNINAYRLSLLLRRRWGSPFYAHIADRGTWTTGRRSYTWLHTWCIFRGVYMDHTLHYKCDHIPENQEQGFLHRSTGPSVPSRRCWQARWRLFLGYHLRQYRSLRFANWVVGE